MSFRLVMTSILAAGLAACGSSSNSSGGGSTCNPGSSTSMSITSSGFSPKSVCLTPGGTVTFNNTDTAPHDIESSGSCSDLNVGTIAAGQSKDVSLANAEVCSIHDANNASNTAFQGTVAVTTSTATGGGY